MEFEWDESKRQRVLEKHGLDFVDVVAVLQRAHITFPGKSEVEPREVAIGFLGETLIAVVYTRRGSRLRVITARRAREYERVAYRAIHQ